METTKKTYRNILQFRASAIAWQQKAPKKDSPVTGFQYAIGRVLRSTEKASEDYNDQIAEINIDGSSTDEKGNILYDARGSTIFKKEESKQRNTKVRELMDIEVEIGVYFAKQCPDDLTAFQIQAFEGFVIPEPTEPAPTADV